MTTEEFIQKDLKCLTNQKKYHTTKNAADFAAFLYLKKIIYLF